MARTGHTAGVSLSVTAVALLLLVLGSIATAVEAARDPALSHEENIKAALREWERGLSGKPINCRRFVDLFLDDGVWSSPAGARSKESEESSKPRVIKGQRPMYNYCEKERLFAGFDQVETFVSGPATISGYSVAFPRTILLIVKDVSCRMTWQGISVIDYDEDYRIKRWQDYWNEEEFERQWKGCQWPTDAELAASAANAAAAAAATASPSIAAAKASKPAKAKSAKSKEEL